MGHRAKRLVDGARHKVGRRGVRLSKKNCTNFVKYSIYFDYFYAGESGAASAVGFCGSLRLWMEN